MLTHTCARVHCEFKLFALCSCGKSLLVADAIAFLCPVLSLSTSERDAILSEADFAADLWLFSCVPAN